MAKNERITDFLIGELLKEVNIDFTPNGSNIKELRDALKTASKKGTGRAGFPEFTAKSGDFILVVENKADQEQQVNYEDETQETLATDTKSITDYAVNGALHYAQVIVEKTGFKKVFAFGCSGDKKHHIIRPLFVDENGYKLLDRIESFENFSEENIENFYREQVLGETPKEVLETQELIKKSAELHEALRNYGQLGDKEKPLVVSAILLALQDKNFILKGLIGDKESTDGDKLFLSIKNYMKKVKVQPEVKRDKVLHQFNILKDRTLLNQIDARLEKTPLRYFTEFIQNEILPSVAANVKDDVLGRFYGEFMRYSGGDGQSLGVVLTPDHITELFCDLVNLKPTDKVFDPCCGTGGFLVAAMHRMENLATDEAQKKHIKSNQLHGIEVREDMFSIATTNMILRDDGKSNLIPADFLAQKVEELREKKYTVGFMNPPYSQAKGKDTAHLSEIHFTEHLLDSLADGARCVVIVPQSTMVGKSKVDKQVKQRILEKHTLEGVITLNKETFYRIGTNPCLAIFTAHAPHPEDKYCKFINFEDDGFIIRKHVGLTETERAKERKDHLLKVWLKDAPTESKFMVKTTVEPTDEWLHSFYYFNDEIPKPADFEKTLGDYLTFEFNMIMQNRGYLFEEQNQNAPEKKKPECVVSLGDKEWGEFYVKDIFTSITRGKRLTKENRLVGSIPLVTAGFQNEGVADFISNEEQHSYCNAITIDMFGNVFCRLYEFKCDDNIHVLKNSTLNNRSLKFITNCIKSTTNEIFSYGKQFRMKMIKKLKILLPITPEGQPNYAYMEAYMKALEAEKLADYYAFVQKRLDEAKLNSEKWGG